MRVYPVTFVTKQDLYNVAMVGKRCYSPDNIDMLHGKVSDLSFDSVNCFLNGLIARGHLSILEHLNFTFGVEDVSRVMTHQLVRHRHFSFAQMSQRYTKSPIGVDEWPLEKYISEAGKAPRIRTLSAHAVQLEDECLFCYNELVAAGVAPEDARYILPGTIATSIFVTGNLRTWIEFIGKRSCMKAQKEIRDFAQTVHGYFMDNEVLETIFRSRHIGPPCITPSGCMFRCDDSYDIDSYQSECGTNAMKHIKEFN